MGNHCGRSAESAGVSSPNKSKKTFSSTSHSTNSSSNSSSKATSTVSFNSIPSFKREAAPAVVSLKPFSLNDLRTATRNFTSSSCIGEGGFGCVFKGWIDERSYAPSRPGAGIVVAIKKLKRESFQGHKEWLAEVTYLSQLRHENLVKLIGYCSEADNRLLVYEYMQKGSLENHLFKRSAQPIPWATRVNIAINIAQGLLYLHSLETQVIFRDLKASNVLLDSDFNAKLSDFGLARNGPTGDKTHVSTRVVGTRGYAAPEYVATGHLSVKSDIYSLGVMLLELLSGRRAFDEDRGATEETLVDWAKPFLNDRRKMLRIMDTRLEGRYSKKGAQAIAALALQCLHVDPKNRPNITEILPVLEELRAPKDANLLTTQHSGA